MTRTRQEFREDLLRLSTMYSEIVHDGPNSVEGRRFYSEVKLLLDYHEKLINRLALVGAKE